MRPVKGNLTERAPGVWRIRVGAGKDPVTGNYRVVRTTFRGTREQAERALAKLLRDVRAGERAGTEGTVAWLLGRYLEHLEASDRAASTLRSYRSYIDGNIIPALGTKPLSKLTAADLDRFYASLRAGGRSTATVRQHHAIISGALSRAVKWGYLARNVAELADPPPLRQREVHAPTVDVVRRLLVAAADRDAELGVFTFLAATTGARRGELCRLRWSDVDHHDMTVRIYGSKTHQTRRLALDPATLEVIRVRQHDQATFAAEAEAVMVGDPYLFAVDVAGAGPHHPDHFTGGWRRLATAEGHPTVRLHDLRHFVATQALAAGHDLRTVAGQLGHGGGGATTLKVYAHVVAHRQRALATTLGALVSGPEVATPAKRL